MKNSFITGELRLGSAGCWPEQKAITECTCSVHVGTADGQQFDYVLVRSVLVLRKRRFLDHSPRAGESSQNQ